MRGATVVLILATSISCAFIGHYQTPAYPTYYADLSFMGALGVFAWGIFGYHLFQHLRGHRHVRAIAAGLLGASLLGAVFLVITDGQFFHLPVTRALLWGPVFGALVLSQCLRPNAVLVNRLLSHLGVLSFSLYLCHPPIVYFLNPVFLAVYDAVPVPEIALLLCVVVTFTLLYPVSRIVFALVEQPGIRAGERMVRRRLCRDNLSPAPPLSASGQMIPLSSAVAPFGGAELLVVKTAKHAAAGQQGLG